LKDAALSELATMRKDTRHMVAQLVQCTATTEDAAMMTNQPLLTECPTWTHNTEDAPDGVARWSGNGSPPWLGDTVNVTVNSLGKGIVKGFFVQHGFLGVGVEIESPPEWYTKQSNGNPIARVFGLEMQREFDIEIDVSGFRNGGELSDRGCDLIEDTIQSLDIGRSARIVCGEKTTAHIDAFCTANGVTLIRGGYEQDPSHFKIKRHAGRMAWRLAELKLEHT
jgi:hypothetical protein